MEPRHPPQATKKQPQPIPTSRQKLSNPQHHHPTQTHVKQQVSSVGAGEGKREGGGNNCYPQPQSFPHPQHPLSAVIPPSAPEVIFEREVATTAPNTSSTAVDMLKLDQLLIDNANGIRSRKKEQEAADEAFARQMQEEKRSPKRQRQLQLNIFPK